MIAVGSAVAGLTRVFKNQVNRFLKNRSPLRQGFQSRDAYKSNPPRRELIINEKETLETLEARVSQFITEKKLLEIIPTDEPALFDDINEAAKESLKNPGNEVSPFIFSDQNMRRALSSLRALNIASKNLSQKWRLLVTDLEQVEQILQVGIATDVKPALLEQDVIDYIRREYGAIRFGNKLHDLTSPDTKMPELPDPNRRSPLEEELHAAFTLDQQIYASQPPDIGGNTLKAQRNPPPVNTFQDQIQPPKPGPKSNC